MNASTMKGIMVCALCVGLPTTASALDVFSTVPEAASYQLVYDLQIPATGQKWNTEAIPYSVDNSGSIGAGSFSRIGYFLELDGSANGTRPNGYVYVSFDAASFQTDASKIGVPSNGPNGSGVTFNGNVTSMNVVSNVAGITTGSGLSGGKLEFWSSNYGTGANGVYDHDDNGFNAGNGHGSMQIHNTSVPQTLIGFSDWGGNNSGAPVELGIGNNPGTGHPDWTFSDSGTTYSVRNLQIVVDNTPLPPPVANAPAAPANLVALCPDLAPYQLIYQEALGTNTNLHGGVAYDADNTGLVQDGSFNRVAYVLELAGASNGDPNGFVCVSFDTAGVTAAANKLGIPVDAADIFYQQLVDNLSVDSNVLGVATGDFLQGNIEFWPTNYNQSNAIGVPGANGGTFDFGDGNAGANGGGYGSMQVHNFLAGQTVFAFNRFGGNHDLGIGNSPTGNPDWTFRGNAGAYQIRNMYVLILPNALPIPEPATLGLLAVGGIALFGRRRRVA